jgi:hypothetical protein
MTNISDFMARAKRQKELLAARAELEAAEAERAKARSFVLFAMGWTDEQAQAVLDFVGSELNVAFCTGARDARAEMAEEDFEANQKGLMAALEGDD